MTDRQQDEPSEKDVDLTGDEFSGEAGGQVESWQDDLPPEDDFHDVGASSEEEASSLEEEPVEEESPHEDVAAGDNRGKKVLFAVVGVGLLLVGGAAYFQFAGGSGTDAQGGALSLASVVSPDQLQRSAGNAQPPLPTTANEPSVTPTTGEVDISTLYKAAQQQPQQAGTMALPNAQDVVPGANKPAVGNSTEVMTLDDAAAPAPSSVPAKEPAAPVKTAADPTKETPVVAKTETLAVPSPASDAASVPTKGASVADANMDGRLKTMGQQIDMLQKSLDDALKQNAELMKKLETAQGAQGETTALQERIKKLEQDLAAASSSKTASREAAVHRADIHLQDEMSSASGESASLSADRETKKPSKKIGVAHKAKKKASSAARTAKTGAASSGWVLRAATPDAAWVAKTSDAAELRRVAVGETLPGLGRVKAIRQKGNLWEVIGTAGTLR